MHYVYHPYYKICLYLVITIWPYLFFFFFSSLFTQFSLLITHHSSLNFHHSSLVTQFSPLITHHLKYPIFHYPTRLDTAFTSYHSNISTFSWDPYLITKSDPLLASQSIPLSHYMNLSKWLLLLLLLLYRSSSKSSSSSTWSPFAPMVSSKPPAQWGKDDLDLYP